MNRSTIAAQMYTLRDFTKTAEDLRSTFQKVSAMGYEAIQISAIGPIDPKLVKEYADESGLAICATHVSWDRLTNDLDALAAEHKLWNCKNIGLGSLPEIFRTGQEGYREFAKLMSDIAVTLKDQHDLQFVYHNHDFEFERFDGMTGMEILLTESDPAVGFELDLYWVQAGGGSPAEWIRKVAGRMQVVHLKDMAIVNRKQIFAEIGEGNMNYKEIINVCRETGVEWFVVEQDVCRRDPFESLEISLRYLLNTL
ncbi:sugar phosphate isomerase/epimerase [Paenibacillus odorifer]|jgi:sugar phosphate isomerase/epimerase|uniref:sugar phosphate isomerase/epimerase family protein n=1 Tax=Paenibacillus TaxID=44249 RepID=UPI0004F90211|nr:sugar phosphate isomerase/epimerase [Paenibacillus odorifer]AIQ74295.1 xylose isomerase [Paenibacillus odorifer]OMC96557.1 xylose isomerase [Paenibacillus odorifer]OMD15379.1 xylose isomerase [Paenibacillus odorifer]OME27298.1 xylose isomerase [Paenibacillus odorifer]OME32819.1 xylose isomerase [Paenibacillus odorifer]